MLLPHSREMARLLECEPEEVEGSARRRAPRGRALRRRRPGQGPYSYIAAPDGRAFRFEGGGIGLATSGSGDVLAGIVGGLAARGADPLTATLRGVWLHGEAGRQLSRRSAGSASWLASCSTRCRGCSKVDLEPLPFRDGGGGARGSAPPRRHRPHPNPSPERAGYFSLSLRLGGDRIVIIAGVPFGTPGSTNVIHSVRLIGDELERHRAAEAKA